MLLLVAPLSLMAQTKEPYAVLSEGNTVLTFYYDENKESRGGMDILQDSFNNMTARAWDSYSKQITTVVFDDSFASCHVYMTNVWFYGFENLTAINGIENLNTESTISMNQMFCHCSSLTSLDLSRFNTANVRQMYGMFSGCSSLTSLDVSRFNTAKVMNMSGMFSGCSSLTSLDVSNFNTANVTDMRGMFSGCSSLTSLDVSNFNTANVTDMGYMFSGCSSLTTIYSNDNWSDNWSALSSEERNYASWQMFDGCENLPNYYPNVDINHAKPIADGGYFSPCYEAPTAVGTDYWQTFYTDTRNVKADANTTVYVATLNAAGTELELTEVADKIVPVGQAVVLKSSVSKPMLYTSASAGTGDYAANSLKGSQRDVKTSSVNGTVYTLAVKDGKLGFYKYTGTTLAARKAYLAIEGAGARVITLGGDNTTGIATTERHATEADGQCYDLQGRRISQPQKGIYIVNGKKMVK